MTSGEFRAWMDGFLIGKATLTKKDIEAIRAKSQEVYEFYRPYWIYNPIYAPVNPVTTPWITYRSASAGDLSSTITYSA